MKNRLQIKYYKPSNFPYTRDAAIQFINDTYADKSSVNKNPKTSLPAEPIAVFYGDDIRTANVLLAIGRGGNGNDYLDNLPYFLIDSAKMEEDIQNLQALSSDHKTLIDEFKNDINSIKNSIKEIETSIKTINSNIGFKNEVGGSSLYGYINAKFEEIWGGNPVENYKNMQQMGTAIEKIRTGLVFLAPLKDEVSTLNVRVDTVNSDLSQSILNEASTRASEDNKLLYEITDLKSVRHEHNNKPLLDSYTQTNDSLKDAVLKTHEHTNKTLLDEITRERVNEWDNSRINSFSDSKQYTDAQIQASRLNSPDKTLIINDTEISVNIDNQTLIRKEEDGELKVNPHALLALKRENDKISLIAYDDTVVSDIDVTDFIKDGMLSKVEISNPIEGETGSKYLVLTFNTSSEQETIRLDVSELIDYYYAGKGISLDGKSFGIKLSELCETAYLNVFEDGLRLSGISNIKSGLDAAVTNLNTEAEKREELTNRVILLENSEHTHGNKDVIDNISNENITSWNKSVNDISILNADLNTENSIKKILFDSIVGGTPITDIRPEDVTNMQSLLRRVNVNGSPYIYASNDTLDMKHNGETLSLVIQNLALKSEIEELRREINSIKDTLANIVNVGVAAAKEAIISEDVFKAANKALNVNVIKGVQVTYDFADDAIFKADENTIE